MRFDDDGGFERAGTVLDGYWEEVVSGGGLLMGE